MLNGIPFGFAKTINIECSAINASYDVLLFKA